MKENEPIVGIHRISTPIPFPVGSVNVYFSENPCPTLLDTPLNDPGCIAHLVRALENLGTSIKDIRRIIVTHPHIDHFGAAGWIAEKSKAEIWASPGAARYMENFKVELERDMSYYEEIMDKAGVPYDTHECMNGFRRAGREFGCQVKVTKRLEEGDEFQLASETFRVMSVPGHTPYCILLYQPEKGVAFSGDFLLNEISSSAVLQRPDVVGGEYRGMVKYIASLKKVKKMNLNAAMPGHGPIIEDVFDRIGELLRFLQRRKEDIIGLLKLAPITPFQIATTLFGELPREELIMGISEVVGFLELLEDEEPV